MGPDSGSTLVLVALGAVLTVGPWTKRTCARFGVPTSVGFIVLGLILGALIKPLNGSSSPAFEATFSTLAQLGVVALLFRVGLRSHTSAMLQKLPRASVIWLANVAGSAATGYLLSRYGLGWSIETGLVVATAFSATSIAVSLAVWDELGLADSDAAATMLDVAELDDLSAAVALAVLLGILPALLGGNGSVWSLVGSSSLIVLTKLTLFIAGCYLFAHFAEEAFTGFNRRMSETPASLTISILGAGMAIAAIAGLLGFSVAIGALFAGLAFSRDPDAVRTDGSFIYFYEFLTPFFFIHIGLQTDLAALASAVNIGILLFIGAALSKLVFTFVAARLSMTRRNALDLGVSMIPRAEIALVVIYECRALDERLVSGDVYAGIVLMSLATCIVAPIALRRRLSAQSLPVKADRG
jgi:Kef-type K+ transport system membrane component KefB